MVLSHLHGAGVRRRYFFVLVTLVLSAAIYFMVERSVLSRPEFQHNKDTMTSMKEEEEKATVLSCPEFQHNKGTTTSIKEEEENSTDRNHFKPRIFDILLINDELDGIELRMKELQDLVDIFFLVESHFTFSRHRKPLHFKEAQDQDRFKQFRHKIVHLVIDTPTQEQLDNLGLKPGDEGWAMEEYSRSAAWDLAVDTYRPSEGDWIIISDVDEIPRRSVLQAIKDQNPINAPGNLNGFFVDGGQDSLGDLVRLQCRLYYYSYENVNGHWWNGPVLTRFRDKGSPALKLPSDQRRGKSLDLHSPHIGSLMRLSRGDLDAPALIDSCFHCSWCFKDMSMVINKLASYSHTDHNTAQVRDPSWIIDHFKTGTDLMDRDQFFEYVPENWDIPETIKQNREAYQYMIVRRNQTNAGFWDMDPIVHLKPKMDPTAPSTVAFSSDTAIEIGAAKSTILDKTSANSDKEAVV